MTTPHAIPPRGEPTTRTLWIVFHLGNFLLASFIAITFVTALAYHWPVGDFFQKTLGMIGAHFAAGNLGNAGAGFKFGMPTWFIIYQCFIQDTIAMCYTYALFAAGYKRFSHWPIIGPRLAGMHQSALENSHIVRPYGIPGLMIFVIVPMWATGPIVGTIVGYVLGLGATTTLLTISTANMISTTVYVNAYNKLLAFNENIAYGVIAVILGFTMIGVLAGMAGHLWFKESKAHSPMPPEDDLSAVAKPSSDKD